MSRVRRISISGLACVAASLAAVAPAAPAEPADPSCLGVLSSFAGQAGIRDQFAPPVSGERVARLAAAHGDFNYCLNLFLSP